MTTTPPAVDESPPCIRCGQTRTREITSVLSPKNERWFECSYCHRVFSIRFIPASTVDLGERSDPGSGGTEDEQ